MTFVTLLSLLQVITLVWLYMIFRVAYKVVTGTGAEDTRSDDEDEGAEEDEAEARIEEKERSSKKGENGYSGNGSTTAVSTGTLSTLIMNGHNSHRRISSSGGGNYIG